MLNSNERMGFIIEYMSSYDEKIKMANKNGLFDAAKMFELFAIEVCNVWFGQKFSNLNDETATYPYVDLISENRELLVQVSTVQDVPTKIKTTLEKIRDSKDKKCSDLKNIVFFVLSNNSIDKVREYSGDNQIGSISFTIKDNLITTNDIITKAQNDLNFQKKLYKVLKDEYENFNINIRKFKGALELSNSGLKNIEGLINGEYEIDRNEFLEKITKDNERYISIQGGAGSGKSVLCKKYVENEKLVLYARAERFLEESHIDDIWGCCIQDVLECINGKKLIFFIDALEFIADCAETKFELLQYLYDMAAERAGISRDSFLDSEEMLDKNADRLLKSFGYGSSTQFYSDKAVKAQVDIIRDLANKRVSAIFFGRCADYVLREYPNHMNVFLYAPLEARIKHMCETYDLSWPEADKLIKRVDRQRHNYYKYVTGKNRGDRDNKHLMIDVSEYGTDLTAEMICFAARKMFED